MNQGDLYDKRIKELEREIIALKTSYVKTATTIAIATKTTTVSFSLTLDTLSGNVYGDQRAIVTLTTNNETEMISACYIANMTPDTFDDRIVDIVRLDSDENTARFGVAVFSQSYEDWQTLYNGGSVSVSYTLQLVGSSNFSVSVSYNSITGGT